MTFQMGNTRYPLDGYTTNSLLKDADKPLYYLLDYFATMLNTYAGARWTAEMARAKITTMPKIVGMKFPNNPFPYIQDTEVKFPLLAIYRTDGKITERTFVYGQVESNLEIIWILPPLTMSQMEIVGPFFNSVRDILSNRSETSFDLAYSDGYNYGDLAGFTWLQMMQYERLIVDQVKTELPMEALVMKLAIRETETAITIDDIAFTGLDTEMDLINDPFTDPMDIIEHFVDMNSDYDPHNFPP